MCRYTHCNYAGCPGTKECKPSFQAGNLDLTTNVAFECPLSCDPKCPLEHELCDNGFDTNGNS